MSSLPDTELPIPRNPWNTEHITGGSSTGSGAALAGGLCLGSLGEDTAGSIRNPSAFCGLAGLKATYGRVSRHGLAPLSWSLDHCGPMARVVEDLAHMLNAIAGHDPKDPTSSSMPITDYTSALREDVKGMSIGVPRAYIDECAPRTEAVVLNRVEEAIAEPALTCFVAVRWTDAWLMHSRVATDLAMDFALDLAVALGYSAALVCAKNVKEPRKFWLLNRGLASFSYTVYLVHFPAMVFIAAKAYPSASGSTKCCSRGGGFAIEQITNIYASGGRDDRLSPLPDRVPTALRR